MCQHDMETLLTGRTYEGNAGFHVVTPLLLDDGRIILVNRGWVSEDYRDPEKRTFSQIEGKTSVAGILRRPGVKGYCVPENEPTTGFWFTLLPSQLDQPLGLGESAIGQFCAGALRTFDVWAVAMSATAQLKVRDADNS